ncbi:MAG: hypothetical protein Q7T60_09210, partial [Sphingopyxis sp.]|nr:hypothetical protein [Sphingopyxis sp.]
MAQDERKSMAGSRRTSLWRIAAAMLVFSVGYATANRFQLIHGVAYRFAAGDSGGAIVALGFMAFQAAIFMAALFLFPRRWAGALLTLAGVSILINIGYTQIVAELIDGGSLAWMLAEVRQAGNAAGEFGGTFLWVAAQVVVAVLLFVLARTMARRAVP